MKFDNLEVIEINPRKGSPNMCVILLHGLGGNAEHLSPVAHVWRLKKNIRPRWVLPQAPDCPVTINNGQIMPAWYDIISIDYEHKIDYASFQSTFVQLTALIEQQVTTGIPAQNILLAGFSQGGAVALEMMLHYPKRLAGVVSLSGYLLNKEKVKDTTLPHHVKQTPIFYAHGEKDIVVPFPLAVASKELLLANNFNLTWRSYPKMGHFVNNREILEIKKWVDDTILTADFII
ncbi:carboxylesterase 2 [Spirochaetota bacterium]|nr:carboxylesterase 2 [Spirochaetota bacterium]